MRTSNWTYLYFEFKNNKAAYSFARWISFGKELGFVPVGLEVRLNVKTVLIGYNGPKD